MACGCVPIGSAVGAIPEIIGQTDLILKTKRLDLLEKNLEKVFSSGAERFSNISQDRIRQNFTFSHRKILLLQQLDLIRK